MYYYVDGCHVPRKYVNQRKIYINLRQQDHLEIMEEYITSGKYLT